MPLTVRLGLFYAAIFMGTGVASPYAPVWFASRGLTGAQIGLILSLPMLARAVTGPLLAVWADSFALRRTALIFMGLAVAGAYALMALRLGFGGWAVAWFCASSVFATISPLTDVIVVRRARQDGFNYGWPRGMGSIGFIVGNVVMGAVLTHGTPDMVLVWLTGAAGLLALSARVLLPPDPVRDDDGGSGFRERMAGVRDLLVDPVFMTAVLSASLIQASHAFYYAFSTLTWKRQGVPEDLTGWLWAAGVVAEVGFMWFLEPWRRRLGARHMLVLGGVASLVRWTALAFDPPLPVMVALQLLHFLTYAATFLAALQLVDRLTTSKTASAGQTINSALSSGLLSGLATLVSGWLFDRWGAHGFLLMSVMAAAGLVGALRLYAMTRLDD